MYIKVSGDLTVLMDKEYSNGQTEIHMKVNGRIVKEMVMELAQISKKISILEIG